MKDGKGSGLADFKVDRSPREYHGKSWSE